MKLRVIAAVLTGLSFAAQAQTKDNGVALTRAASRPVTGSDSLENKRLYLSALRERTIGNNDLAIDLYSQVLRTEPGNDAALYELALLKKQKGTPAEVRTLLEKAVALKPQNEWYWLALTDSYEKTNDLPRIENAFKELIRINPNKPEYYLDEASALFLQQKYSEALALYNQLEQQSGLTDEIIAGRERIYLKQNNVSAAAGQLKQMIDEQPGTIRYYLMLAEIYNSNHLADKALPVLQQAQALQPANPLIYLALADVYKTKKDYQSSYNQIKLAFGSPEMDVDRKIQIVMGYAPKFPDPNAVNSAVELSQIITLIHPTEARGFALYGDVLVQNQQYRDARAAFQQSITLNHSIYAVHEQLVRLDLAENDYQAALTHSEQALALFPDQAWMNYFSGVAYQQTKQPAKAIGKLTKAASLAKQDNQLQAQAYSSLGDCYHELHQYTASDEAYDKALVYDADNTYTLNNYAYYLSLRNEQLEKAAKMSARSNELQHDVASFEDTYAWILFKQQKYADAKAWMEKALQHNKNHSGVQTEHYGDILYHLGEDLKAVDNWKKAKRYGVQSAILEKKINEKKYVE
ncbi:tetratricopeptide repeat protein [Mucilaginibacter sp.]